MYADTAPNLSDFDRSGPMGSLMFASRRLPAASRSFGKIIQNDNDIHRVLLGPDYRLSDQPVDVPMFVLAPVNDDTIL